MNSGLFVLPTTGECPMLIKVAKRDVVPPEKLTKCAFNPQGMNESNCRHLSQIPTKIKEGCTSCPSKWKHTTPPVYVAYHEKVTGQGALVSLGTIQVKNQK